MKAPSDSRIRYLGLCFFLLLWGIPALAHAGMVDRLNQSIVNYKAFFCVSFVCQAIACVLALALNRTRAAKSLKAWSMRKSTRPSGIIVFSIAAGILIIPYFDICFSFLWVLAGLLYIAAYAVYAIRIFFSKYSLSWKALYWGIILAFAQVFATAAYWFLCPVGFFKELFKYTDDGYVEGFFMYPERFLLNEVGQLSVILPVILIAPFIARWVCLWLCITFKKFKRARQ